MINFLHIHYDEIGLKGKNKRTFEKLLHQNIAELLAKYNVKRSALRIEWGFLSLDLAGKVDNLEGLLDDLKYIPGINHVEMVYRLPIEQNELDYKAILAFVEDHLQKDPEAKKFRVTCRRVDKYFPIKSGEINKELGHLILEKFPQLSVSMKEFDFNLKMVIRLGEVFLHLGRIEGIGGLPVGTAGKVVSLLSGGIDSPVASALMLKRGADVILVHFQNQTINQEAVEDKINQLAAQISKFKANLKLYIVPFDQLQREIIKVIPSDYRMIVYKRIMLKVSEIIALQERAKALATGDSLSQVASQTLDNIYTIYEAVKLPILSPLIGLNKKEITDISRKIGTYDISILPYGDCCSLLLSSHPQTHAKLATVLEMEKNLNIADFLQEAVKQSKIYYYPEKK